MRHQKDTDLMRTNGICAAGQKGSGWLWWVEEPVSLLQLLDSDSLEKVVGHVTLQPPRKFEPMLLKSDLYFIKTLND